MKTVNCAVALICAFILSLGVQVVATTAQAEALDDLFAELLAADEDTWEDIEKQIWLEWSKSGSKAMDHLLQRGRVEMEKGNVDKAIKHFSALIDHAPEFAEGWNARATAWFVVDRYGLSIADIQQTLILEPRHFGALAGLGMILERMNRPKAALQAYQEAQKVHPNRPNVKAALARLEDKVRGIQL
tara:strand:+ start:47 stop:607 length:561 start_codon:yes stop_codon:yes gene_type:complete